MSHNVTLGLILSEPFVTGALFEAEVGRLDGRIDAVAEAQAGDTEARIAALQQQVDALVAELAAVKQSKAEASDLDTLQVQVMATVARVDEVDARLDGFSFRSGDVAAYQALPALDPRQMFLVVDTAEALQMLAQSDVVAGSDKRFGLVFAPQ